MALDMNVGFQVATAVVTAAFGVVVLTGGPRQRPNQFLAFFFLLITGNQVAEILRGQAATLADQRFWLHVATVFAALDPFFLYYFASIHPERNTLNDGWKVAAVASGSLFVLLTSVGRSPQGPVGLLADRQVLSPFLRLAWAGFTAAVYAVVLVHIGRRVLPELENPGTRYLVPAIAIVTLPAFPRIAAPISQLVEFTLARKPTELLWIRRGVVGLGVLAIVVAAALVWVRRQERAHPAADPRARRVLRGGIAVGLVLASLVPLQEGVSLAGAMLPGDPLRFLHSDNWGLRRLTTALRWLGFSALVSMSVLREQMLDVGLRARRWSARMLVAVGVLVASGLAIVVGETRFGDGQVAFRSLDLLVVALIVVASQRFQTLVDWTAEKIYAVPMPGDEKAALATYRRAVRQAIEEGRPVDADPALARLRDELELDDEAAEALHATVREAAGESVELGETLRGRYHVSRLIDRGGQGRVYLGHDEMLDRDVALKTLPRPGRERKRTAIEEARKAAKLEHRNFVTVYDVLEIEDEDVIVTAYVPGGTLAEWMGEREVISWQQAAEMVVGILNGLEVLHEEGIVHRDVKPRNVLVGADGTPKVTDLGVARVRDGTTQTKAGLGEVVGTPAYMAPEQRKGHLADERSDQYAVGRILEELIHEEVPTGIEEVIRRALAEDPQRRWPSVAAMRERLEAILQDGGAEEAGSRVPD